MSRQVSKVFLPDFDIPGKIDVRRKSNNGQAAQPTSGHLFCGLLTDLMTTVADPLAVGRRNGRGTVFLHEKAQFRTNASQRMNGLAGRKWPFASRRFNLMAEFGRASMTGRIL
uniref:(northern house mosquito) hypothetical protein n=1 Tax=Culex pipiens TaxID=7175 RepID=A0A8D8GYR8_CULPI